MAGAINLSPKEFDGSIAHEILAPSSFSLPTVSNASLSAWTSGSFSTAGTSCRISVSATNCFISLDNSTWVTSLPVVEQGATVFWKVQASDSYGTPVNYSIVAGSSTQNASVTTFALDITPDTFALTSWTNSVPLSVNYGSFVVTGVNTYVAVSGTGCEVCVDDGITWGTGGAGFNINNNGTVRYRATASANSLTTSNYSITVGDETQSGSITTQAPTYAPTITSAGQYWGGGTNWRLCAYPKNAGKWYCEVYVQTANAVFGFNTGYVVFNVAAVGNYYMTIDFDTRTVSLYDSNGSLIRAAPMYGTVGAAYTVEVGQTSWSQQTTINFGADAFVLNMCPSGFNNGIWA